MIAILVLAVIQGVAEFLPISSSAHLIIFRDLFGIGNNIINENMNLSFDVALHLGTLLAIMVYFFKDFWNIIVNGITKGPKDSDGRLLWLIITATIPAALVGIIFEDIIEEKIRDKFFFIAILLILMGIIIYVIDKKYENNKGLKDLNFKDALIIGFAQVFALFPGVSRSGVTIAEARKLKVNREESAKFSFYLSFPIVLGAVILQLFKTDFNALIDNISVFLIGISTSFIVGILSIKYLLNYLKSNDFKIFLWYRVALGTIILWYLLIK